MLVKKRFSVVILLFIFYMAAIPCIAEIASVSVTQMVVSSQANVPELQCATSRRKTSAYQKRELVPQEIPDDSEVRAELNELSDDQKSQVGIDARSGYPKLERARLGEPYRVALWGDSHISSGIFTSELLRILELPSDQLQVGFIPANINRPGVNLPVRKSCLSNNWHYEAAYVSAAGAAAPGPGLVNLFSNHIGATVTWDLRDNSGVAQFKSVRVLYQQMAEPVRLGLVVDGANEIAIALSASSGPAALEIVSESPISTVQLRLLEGNFRLHGLAYPNNPKAAIQIDLFGFPGATVSGWERANNDYISSWFAENKYDLVMLEFGTNEGNAKPFKAGNYEQSLRNAMKNFRGIFPLATCVLVGPGDRGQLVRRIGKARKKSGELTNNVSRFPSKVGSSQNKSPEGGLLRFGQIHQEIGRIQTKVAKEYGCRAWSMLNAMGGVGSAYQWAQQKPPLMARDLIHFTTLGYQRIAQIFAKDLGWSAAKLLSVNGGSGYER